jgi:CheY-like chemotaxis protein
LNAPVPSVWVADRDELFRGSLAHALRSDGAHVVELASGSELGASAVGGEPDLIVLATDRQELDGCQMYARLKSPSTGKQFPLVLVTQKSRPLDEIVSSVQGFLADWRRLCVRNLAGVLALLQVRRASGRFEVEAFGSRGTIVLREGEVLEARWRSLEGQEVLRFFAEELPNVGFRFAQRLEPARVPVLDAAAHLPAGPWQPRLAPSPSPVVAEHPEAGRSRPTAWLDQARRALLEANGLPQAFLYLRIAEESGADSGISPGEVQYLLGLAHLKSGDVGLATDELRKASLAFPGDPWISAALAEALQRVEASRRTPPAATNGARLSRPHEGIPTHTYTGIVQPPASPRVLSRAFARQRLHFVQAANGNGPLESAIPALALT